MEIVVGAFGEAETVADAYDVAPASVATTPVATSKTTFLWETLKKSPPEKLEQYMSF